MSTRQRIVRATSCALFLASIMLAWWWLPPWHHWWEPRSRGERSRGTTTGYVLPPQWDGLAHATLAAAAPKTKRHYPKFLNDPRGPFRGLLAPFQRGPEGPGDIIDLVWTTLHYDPVGDVYGHTEQGGPEDGHSERGHTVQDG